MENCATGKGYLANIARAGLLHLELMRSAEFCRLIPVLDTCGSAVELAQLAELRIEPVSRRPPPFIK